MFLSDVSTNYLIKHIKSVDFSQMMYYAQYRMDDNMKFNVKPTASEQAVLTKQYKEYINGRTMTDKERDALQEWVMDGNSPYDNPLGLWKDSFHPVEFLEVYRDEEYIEEHTKGMTAECRNRFAAEYFGFSVPEDHQ